MVFSHSLAPMAGWVVLLPLTSSPRLFFLFWSEPVSSRKLPSPNHRNHQSSHWHSQTHPCGLCTGLPHSQDKDTHVSTLQMPRHSHPTYTEKSCFYLGEKQRDTADTQARMGMHIHTGEYTQRLQVDRHMCVCMHLFLHRHTGRGHPSYPGFGRIRPVYLGGS